MSEFIPRDNDAWAIIRGFVYQVDLTIERWIHLTDGQILELERGEDIDLVTRCLVSPEQERERLLEQVKHRDKNLTLRKPAAIEAVVNFFEHRRINPNLHLLFQYTTNAQVTAERPAMMPNNEPAIAVWESIRCGIYPQDHVARAIQGFQTIFREAFESRQRASGTKLTFRSLRYAL